MSNLWRTGALLAGLTALFMGVGYLGGGGAGILTALAIAAATNVYAYWNADRLVLAAYGARPIARAEAPWLYDILARLADRGRIAMPRLCVIESAQPNAFATGRDPDHATVAATRGLLDALGADEVAAVTGHELSHVLHRDTLTMTVTATVAGAIGMRANLGFFLGPRDEREAPPGGVGTLLVALLAPIAALLVQMTISRTREYAADRAGAEQLSSNPLALASALDKIEALVHGTVVPPAELHPATAHLFIVNPLHGRSLARLFATPPATAERVRRLEATAVGRGAPRHGPWGAPRTA